ncbi:MAG: hypothetical protein ABSF56_01600 [Minisyncoccia bacterium]|jgi:hypothetical protein
MPSEERSRIEDLKRSLYSRTAPDVRTRRKLRFSDQVSGMKTHWDEKEEPEEDAVPASDRERRSMSFFTKLLIGSLIFCVLAVGAGAYIFFYGANLISANNIDVAISGPVSVPGGSPVTLTITVTNRNSVPLKTADLAVSFPAGATDPNDTTKPLTTYRELLGDLAPGASVSETVQAVLFGEENLEKEITATVTYNINGSSSIFTKEQSYGVLINSSPVILSVSSFDEVTSGEPFDMTVDVKSNSENILKNIILQATYPFGYVFGSSSVKPTSSGNAAWTLGDIPPGADRKIVIHGTLTGENSDLRAFHFTVGAGSQDSPDAISMSYMDAEKDVTIKKPFISLSISVDNDSSTADHVGQFGKPATVVINWTNNVPEALSNVEIDAHLSGSAYDKTSVSSPGGYFRSATDDIIWNQQTEPDLASVAAGGSGSATFVVTPSDNGTTENPAVNPVITIAGSATADRTAESNVPESTAQVARTIRISSSISLSGHVTRSGGAFTNTGPIPPKAEQKTTYTIVWTVDNSSNAVSNASVTATLPPYVSWLGQSSPPAENVTYDGNSGTVTWDIGNINANTAGTTGRREVQFQVSLLPSVDQIGQVPILVNRALLSATDNWTGAALSSTQDYLTTSFSTDSSFRYGNETVINGQ